MPMTQCVMEAGGRGMLLVPDDENIVANIKNGIDYVRSWFHVHLAGTLRVDIGVSKSLSDADFSSEHFARTYSMAAGLVEEARFRECADLFHDEETGWNDDAWVLPDPGLPIDTGDWPDVLKKLGQVLTKARYLSLSEEPLVGDLWSKELLGYRVSLFAKRPPFDKSMALILDDDPTMPVLLASGYVPRITNNNIGSIEKLSSNTEGYHLGDPITLDALAHFAVDEDCSPAPHPMLGVLKADVDDLGFLMSSGLTDHVSLGRIVGVSRTLDELFKGYLPARLHDQYTHVYTVFSGGDDLFFIGPWLDILRLTADVRHWLNRACADNEALTISAGVIFAKPKTPIRVLAEQAEESLEIAKDAGKNRVAVGNVVIGWNSFTDALKYHRELFLLSQRNTEKLNSSMLYRLYRYAVDANACANAHASGIGLNSNRYKWRAQMSYDLRRNLGDWENKHDMSRVLSWLQSTPTPGHTAAMRLATMMALYRVRGDNQNDISTTE